MCRWSAVLMSALTLLLTCLAAPLMAEGDPAPLTFIPQWVPQAQWAGYYVALEKGFYRTQGLDVRILDGGPDKPPSALLASGEAQLGTFFLSDAIARRSRGEPLENLAQLVQRSSQLLVARKSSGINSIEDLNGKRVGLWGAEFQVQPRALFDRYNLKPEVVPQYVTIDLFLRGAVDVASAMWHNEYHSLINSGLDPEELTVFFYDRFGLNFPEEGIYCRGGFCGEHREEVCRFVKASLEGWRYAFEHTEEALDIVMPKAEGAHVITNRVHQRWMLHRMKDIILPPGGPPLGVLKRDAFHRVSAALAESGAVQEPPSYEDLYRGCVPDA